MIDSFGHGKFLCKISSLAALHQIGIKPENIEQTQFNKKHCQCKYPFVPMNVCNTTTTTWLVLNEELND